jgi:2,3-bisphosphoglycerate-independent phosphoglycerate mutase
MTTPRKPVVLIIRDGWGRNPFPDQNVFNAVYLAKKPCDDLLHKKYPHALVLAGGYAVGLPEGVMGNSEVGHENIGAGRIVEQELLRLNMLFSRKRLATNAAWNKVVMHVQSHNSRLHLMGIVSDAGVHGMLEHLYGILRQAKTDGVKEVFIHAFTDGRDTPPTSGLDYVRQVEKQCQKIGLGKIATVCGRFWAMDRDNRWERVSKAYFMLTGKEAVATAPSAGAAVSQYYKQPLTETQKGDEFVAPTWVVGADGQPIGTIREGDGVVFYNYRGDRPREITKAFVLDDFKGFDRGPKLKNLCFATMTEYEAGLPVEVISPKPEPLKGILGQVVSDAGLAQFRCAETEKNPHVTFFFNNYRVEPFPGEDRACPPSPKVATYDLAPEMNAAEVTRLTKEAILSGKYSLVVVNFANPDMVGHTGSLTAAIKAVEVTDRGVAELLDAIKKMKGQALVCADHGNCEQMWDPVNNCPHTSHTTNRIEAFVVGPKFAGKKMRLRRNGRLCDIAPTLVELMGLTKPKEMTGESLLPHPRKRKKTAKKK